MTDQDRIDLDEASTKLAELRVMLESWSLGNAYGRTFDQQKEDARRKGQLDADLAYWTGRKRGILSRIEQLAEHEARA